jgi:TfoX/Sxy family transcriptional regulator of competence genes
VAYDEALADILRRDLAADGSVEERKMFGGLCFMLDGHMLCGVHAGGGLFRVGKSRANRALAIQGASEMALTGRKMGGVVDVLPEVLADPERRGRLMAMARANVASLPPR